MTATLAPIVEHDILAERLPPTARRVLILLHAEHDSDDTLIGFAARVGDTDHVTLANIRPAANPVLPPSMVMSDLGVMVYLDWRQASDEAERRLDMRIAARSALLRELGIDHEIITVTYHRSMLARGTRRNLRRAIRRVARRARADEVMVGPGAILECLLPD